MRFFPQIFKVFSKTERLIFIVASVLFLVTSALKTSAFLEKNTVLIPVSGGEYAEGVVGQPTFINPILASNNDVDRDLIEVLFSNIIELADNYRVSKDGQTLSIRLKENIFWHDGQPITSDDVIFTIKAIQSPDVYSQLFSVWEKIKAERVSEREVKLILPEPYSFFETSLENLRPIPKHIFGDLPAVNIKFSEYNFEPIGSGPFKFVSFKKERSGFINNYQLEQNENFFDTKPYLDKLVFKFYRNENDLIEAFNSAEVDGFGINSSVPGISIPHQTFSLLMPRYYAVFFNPNSHPALKDKNVRLALNYATDKNRFVEEVFNNRAIVVNGPLVPLMEVYSPNVYPQNDFSLEQAGNILENGGWITEDSSDGIRRKATKGEIVNLEFKIVVPNIPFLVRTAELIQEDWKKIGVKLELINYSVDDISKEVIKTRDYEMIMFGNIFASGGAPDLSSFWHSSERFYPGLNLALYSNNVADRLIESIRKDLDPERRQRNMASLQSLIIQDAPAIFLFSPNYFYITTSRLNGFEENFIPLASDRFKNVEKWYLKTARSFK